MPEKASTIQAQTSRAPHKSGARAAWTAYWQEPGPSHCTSGAPDIWQVLAAHWSSFAMSLAPGDRVLDLGCGAGAVAHFLLAGRQDVHVTGIDFAHIPFAFQKDAEFLSDTAMESMPFAERSFAAAVSQFGFEYGDMNATVKELGRVLAPGAKLSLLVHHTVSSIAISNRYRLSAIIALLGEPTREAFCGGDLAAFNTRMALLLEKYAGDTLVAEFARTLPSRLDRPQRERSAIWKAIEQALAPEQCLAEALQDCCVAPEELEDWLGPLRSVFTLKPASLLREQNGAPIAWRIEGARLPT